MNLESFKSTITSIQPPKNLSPYLESLWYDAKGDWDKAHLIIQDIADKNASWIHAYLHRKEGDIWNADYWYQKAGKKRPGFTLDEEWDQLVRTFLAEVKSQS
jgi:hypothetical protein